MNALPESIDAFGQLQGWHLIAFLGALIIIARPEWLGIIWQSTLKRLGVTTKRNGNGGKSPTITEAMSVANQVRTRLDEHERHCDERQRSTQSQLDRRFNSVDGRLDTLETDMSEVKTDLGEIKGYLKGQRDAHHQ